MVSASVWRRQVAVRMSSVACRYRRACALLYVACSSLRYESRLAMRDAPVVTQMRELSAQVPAVRLSSYSRVPRSCRTRV